MRLRRDVVAMLASGLLLVACGEGSQAPGGPAGPEEPAAPVSSVVVSAPVPRTLLGQAGTETVAFVAAPTGTVARGRAAALVNRRTGARVDALVAEGGFDPVALVAEEGDVVEVTLTDSASQVTTTTLEVKRGTRPRVVRTAPAPRATDVPLNTVIRVVFTTPVRASEAAQAIRLLAGGVEVAGTVRVTGEADVVVDFAPAAPLAANAGYELRVDATLMDVLGLPLEAGVAVPFTTGTTIAAPTGLSPVNRLKEVVFSNDGALYAMRADGSGLTGLLSATAYRSTQPHVSRDGRIVFVAHLADPWVDLGVRERDGTVRLLNLPSHLQIGFPECPVWSPDMRYLAFRRAPFGFIHVVYADSTDQEVMTIPGEGHGCPSWSPDGTRLSFLSNVDGGFGFGETWLYSLASGSLMQLTTGTRRAGRWSGDGNALLSVYNEYIGNMMESVDIRGTVVQVIDARDGSARTIWSGGPIVVSGVSDWSEDGRLVAVPEWVWAPSGPHVQRIWFVDGGWDDGRGWTASLAPTFGQDPAFVPDGVSFTR